MRPPAPMPSPTPSRRIVPLLAAVAGVVVAHALDYLVVFPSTGARDGNLQATGHAYWPIAVGAAVAAAALALIAVAARGALRTAPARPDLRLGGLLALQLVAFMAMEAGERALVGLPPSVLLHSAEFWLGLALQLPVAWLARRLLGAVDEVAHRITTVGRARAAATPYVWRPNHVAPPRSVASPCRAQPRGPPHPLVACF